MSTIRNTAEDAQGAGAMLILADSMERGVSATIEAMEARGQREIVASEQLPVRSDGDDRYVALGFTFGEPGTSDPLFRPATLPVGWSRRATDHSMWSEIVDELGRKRVSVFYKAAFYDRDAFMRLESPTSYLHGVLYHDVRPVLDETWLTLGVARETLDAIAAQSDKEADEADELARQRPSDDYWPERAKEHRADAAKARAMAAAFD